MKKDEGMARGKGEEAGESTAATTAKKMLQRQ